nr:hypothetical protein [Thermoleophilaceae bacterium]
MAGGRGWTAGATLAVALLALAPSAALADAPQTEPPAPNAPSSPPTVSGTPLDGETLTGDDGDWGPFPPPFSYEWFRCDDAAGTVCDDDPVAGRTAKTYLLGPADVGRRLKIRVRGAGLLGGYREVDSQPSAVIQAIPPTNTALPAISGTPRAGRTLSTTDGDWQGTSPLSFTYQWRRCDSVSCTNIGGATGSSYTATRTDMA